MYNVKISSLGSSQFIHKKQSSHLVLAAGARLATDFDSFLINSGDENFIDDVLAEQQARLVPCLLFYCYTVPMEDCNMSYSQQQIPVKCCISGVIYKSAQLVQLHKHIACMFSFAG
jgi:hypothetical protein